ncbi:hypothetical protein GF407_06275 [candidate division KSB1 bacterium]|jgi:hypothetical protein|nr:hypothetical protein [candidate division KSB1 bacterium]
MIKKLLLILTSILIAGALIYGFTAERPKSKSEKTPSKKTSDVTPPIAQPPQE